MLSPFTAPTFTSYRKASSILSLLVLVVGCSVFVGWLLNVQFLKSLGPNLATMKVNAALGFVSLGVAIALANDLTHDRRRLSFVAAGFAILLGSLTLVEYAFNMTLGIDQLLIRDSASGHGIVTPGRMAPSTALNFALLGCAIVLMPSRRAYRLAQLLALTAAVSTLLALSGYLYHAEAFYGIGGRTQMALHTAASGLVLSCAVLLMRPSDGVMTAVTSNTAGGVAIRRLLPVVVIVPLLLGWLRLEGQQAVRLYGTEFGLSLLVTTLIVVLVAVVWTTGSSLARSDGRRQQAAKELAERARLSGFGAEVAVALTEAADLRQMLQRCAEAMVRDVNAAFARIWTLNVQEQVLELQASAGMFTHIDGGHARVPVGQFKIGLIAAEQKPHLTNQVLGDPRVGDQDWARREAMVSFAGYPLLLKGQLLGVMAMFSREPLSEPTFQAMESIAREVSLGIERMNGALAVRRSEELLRRIAEHTSVGVYQLDKDRRPIYLNASACAMLDADSQEEVACHTFESFFTPASLETMQAEHAKRADGTASTYEVEIVGLRGTHRYVIVSGAPLVGDTGEFENVVGTIVDITERKRHEQTLVHLASHDPLTDVFNRRRFQEEVERLATTGKDSTGAVLFIDIDDFKDVNDSFGHLVGDKLLIRIAETLAAELDETSVLARLGGDEFAVLLRGVEMRQAVNVAKRLLRRLQRQPLEVDGKVIQTFASVGIALLPTHGRTTDELLELADFAMYEAKARGRNRVSVYSEHGRNRLGGERIEWKRRIREAIDKDGLTLYAHPVVDIKTDEIVKYELLVRMRTSRGKLLLPGSFLGIAEGCGLIGDIDRWVVRKAIHLVESQQDRGNDLKVAINLSPSAVGDSEVLRLIKGELERTKVDPAHLCFEITEGTAFADRGKAAHFIGGVHTLGCQVALDDFGVGFSSLSRLKLLSPDELKIDGSFIRNLKTSAVDQHLVRGIVEMARGLGIKVVAEYVEDEETLKLLRQYGVGYGQGFYWGAPAPVAGLALGTRGNSRTRAA
jgi:diguanylate cyclase (GGDEF)-like protein/PAS domain S-box-containing protein